MTRRLVVTADDLGRDARTTATILDLAVRGLVSATTLVPVAPTAAVAAVAAAELGLLPRLHVTLTSERGLPRWRPLSAGSSLAEHDGGLPGDPAALDADASDEDIETEIAAQLGWMRAQGVPPGGADTHAGVLYGLGGRSRLVPTLRWCAAEGLAFRLPRDLRPYPGDGIGPELVAVHRDAVDLADALGVPLPAALVTNPLRADDLGSYAVLRERMIAAISSLPDGTSEVFLHPADGLDGDVGVVRAWEARLLRDPLWAEAIDAAGIQVVPDWWSTSHT